MSKVFVDTPVLLSAFDESDPPRRASAQAWLTACWMRRCGRLSTQVLSEFYANARERFASALSAGDARAEVRRYALWKPWQIDQATIDTAWAAESRWRIPFWDALMVASAQQQGCAYLLTLELPHELELDGLRILNPFVVGPEILEAPTP